MALFRFVRSNPQERSAASVSPALARVARCAFVRRNTRVRKVRMVRRVRRAFPGRYRGVRARVRRSNRSRLTRRARFFWRRGAIDRRILGWRLRTGERARTHARSGFSQTGNQTVVLWFKVDDSHYVFWRAALRFSAGKRGEPRSAVYARSLPSSPLELGAICRPPPVLLSRGIMPRLASASPFSAEKKSARDEKRAAADGVDPSFHSVASRRLPGGGSSVGFPPVSACPATSGAFFLPSPGASEAFGQVLNGV